MQSDKKTYHFYFSKLKEVGTRLRAVDGFLAVGIGYKEKNNVFQEQLCYRVYVKEKKPVNAIDASQKIEGLITDAETDVVEPHVLSQALKNHPESGVYPNAVTGATAVYSREQKSNYGTAGCVGSLQNGTTVLLTGKHVVYNNITNIDTRKIPVFSKQGESGISHSQRIGETICGIQNGKVDCALIRCNRGEIILSSSAITAKTACATPGDIVSKSGAGSGVTIGRILHIGNIASKERPQSKIEIQQSKILIASLAKNKLPFSIPGDSGSLITNQRNEAVGVVEAGILDRGTIITVASPMEEIISAFDQIGFRLTPEFYAYLLNSPDINIPGLTIDESGKLYNFFRINSEAIFLLIRRSRYIALVWKKYQGPSFAASIRNYLSGASRKFPTRMGDVELKDFAGAMLRILSIHGNENIKIVVERESRWLLSCINRIKP